MNKASFSQALLHPRYWLTWCSLAVCALLAQLPFKLQIWLGKQLGRLMYLLAKKRRYVAWKNLCLCYPELLEAERKALLKRNFESTGIAFFETIMSWFGSYRRLQKRFRILGEEHWREAESQGLLIVGMHFLTLEMANVHLNRHYSYHMIYRPHRNKVYDYVQMKRRQRHNRQTAAIPRSDMRMTIRALKNKEWVWYAPDQDYGRRLSDFVPWYSIPCATLKATPKLAKMGNARVALLSYYRRADNSGYDLVLHPPLENFPSGDDQSDLQRLNQAIEACVRQCPEQYMWVHRRFKTRPKGEPSLY